MTTGSTNLLQCIKKKMTQRLRVVLSFGAVAQFHCYFSASIN